MVVGPAPFVADDVRADHAGVTVGGALVVTRAAIATAWLEPAADGGFAVVLAPARGKPARVALRDELDARALLRALELDPHAAPLVFPRLAPRRAAKDLAVLAGAVVCALAAALALASPAVRAAPVLVVATASAAALALSAALRRTLRTTRVALDDDGLLVGRAARIPFESILRVEADAGSPDVDIQLDDGHVLTLRFPRSRSTGERELFVARIRARLGGDEIDASGPRLRFGTRGKPRQRAR